MPVIYIMRIFLLIYLIFILSCCSYDDTSSSFPDMDKVPEYISTTRTLGSEDTSNIEHYSNNSLGIQKVLSIGKKDGKEGEIIGEISDVTIDSRGRILVLDSSTDNIKVYNMEGMFVESIGRTGSGPGEFRYPEDIVMSSGDWFAVTERNGKIHFFGQHKKSYRYDSTATVNFTPEDACTSKGYIFLAGFKAESLDSSIHVYNKHGSYLRSFGPVYMSDNKSVRERLSKVNIACDKQTGRVVLSMSYFPIAYGYTPDGELQWTTKIAPFNPITISRSGSTLEYANNAGDDLINNSVDIPGDSVIIQRETQEEEESDEISYSYSLSSTDGNGTMSYKTKGTIKFVGNSHLIVSSLSPFPNVKIYKYK